MHGGQPGPQVGKPKIGKVGSAGLRQELKQGLNIPDIGTHGVRAAAALIGNVGSKALTRCSHRLRQIMHSRYVLVTA